MATIMVPTMAYFEDDLKTNLNLLEKIVQPKGHEIGLEIIGKPNHFLEKEGREKMVDNLKKHTAGLRIASHQWSGNVIYDPSPDNLAWSDLRTERGRNVLECGIAFAQEAINTGLISEGNGVYVHTHGGELYFGERIPEEDLKKQRDLIKQSLLIASEKNPRIKIGLESIPAFPNSDEPGLIKTPEKVGRTVFETLGDYKDTVEGTNLKLTFDTAHYSYDLKEGEIDLCSAIDVFKDYLKHIHISDARGHWVPYKSVAGDGYIPGEGKIGSEEFERFFKHLKENYDLSKVSIEAEVKDTDYANPLNREETLKRIVGWLD